MNILIIFLLLFISNIQCPNTHHFQFGEGSGYNHHPHPQSQQISIEQLERYRNLFDWRESMGKNAILLKIIIDEGYYICEPCKMNNNPDQYDEILNHFTNENHLNNVKEFNPFDVQIYYLITYKDFPTRSDYDKMIMIEKYQGIKAEYNERISQIKQKAGIIENHQNKLNLIDNVKQELEFLRAEANNLIQHLEHFKQQEQQITLPLFPEHPSEHYKHQQQPIKYYNFFPGTSNEHHDEHQYGNVSCYSGHRGSPKELISFNVMDLNNKRIEKEDKL